MYGRFVSYMICVLFVLKKGEKYYMNNKSLIYINPGKSHFLCSYTKCVRIHRNFKNYNIESKITPKCLAKEEDISP